MPSLTPQYQSRCVRLLTALLLLCPIPVCLYGPRAALLLVIGLACAFLCDLIFRPLFGLERKKRDLSSYITALLITLLLPASISWYGVICGVVTGRSSANTSLEAPGGTSSTPPPWGLRW